MAVQARAPTARTALRRALGADAGWGYLFIAPQMLGLLVFVLGPVLASFAISLSDWDLASGVPTWVGAKNYRVLFERDPIFWRSVRNTLYYTVASVPLAIVLAMAIALVANRRMRAVTLYRSLCFAPTVTSSVAIAVIWGWLLHSNYGPVNLLLTALGLPGPKWLSDPNWAMPAVVIVAIWHAVGYNFVLFLAGLKNIPLDLYEAARVDGASDLQRLRHVTLPLLTPTTFFILVVSIIGSFRSFDMIWVMTAGGPINATNVLLVRMYELGFQFFRLGEASAVAWLIFLIVMVMTAIQFRLGRWVHYG